MEIFRRNVLQHEKCCPPWSKLFLFFCSWLKQQPPVHSQSCVAVTISVVVSSGWSLIRRASFFAAILSLIKVRGTNSRKACARWCRWQLTVQSLTGTVPEVFAIKLMARIVLRGDVMAKPPVHIKHFKFQPKRFYWLYYHTVWKLWNVEVT